jgi:hypothetical protein
MTLFIDVDDAARLFTTIGIRRAIRDAESLSQGRKNCRVSSTK